MGLVLEFHRCPGSISLLGFVFSLTSDFELLLMVIHSATSEYGGGKAFRAAGWKGTGSLL